MTLMSAEQSESNKGDNAELPLPLEWKAWRLLLLRFASLLFSSLLFPKIVGISVLDEAFAPLTDLPVVGTGAQKK
jgi:hypothetical protein